jgi:hypothetical protein
MTEAENDQTKQSTTIGTSPPIWPLHAKRSVTAHLRFIIYYKRISSFFAAASRFIAAEGKSLSAPIRPPASCI